MAYEWIIPMVAIAAISLLVTMLTNRSFSTLMGVLGVSTAVMVWTGEIGNIFYIVSILFIGAGFWLALEG